MNPLLSLIELAANTTLAVLGSQGIAPASTIGLIMGIENAVNPLIDSLKSGSAPSAQILSGFASMIGVLNAVKKTPGVDAGTVEKVEAYMDAAQDGITAYLQAGNGLDLDALKPVTPIV